MKELQAISPIEKYFEVEVKPETIRSKARRVGGGSFDPPEASTENNTKNTGTSNGIISEKLTQKQIARAVEEELETSSSEIVEGEYGESSRTRFA